MANLESVVKKYEMEIRAGPEGENSDVYAWVNTPIPSWAKTVDDPTYRLYANNALEFAKNIVRGTKKEITLKFSVEYRS